jgi:methyltransferase (TIGR00027 family)
MDSGPSITARRVAAYRLGFERAAAPYGDPAADQALAADVAAGLESRPGRMRDYLAARTRFFDQVVVGALGRGVRQIVIAAAGYDGRALRYAKPGALWFEVDQPATQRDKRDRLSRLGITAGQVRFVEADFTRDPVTERLLAAGLAGGERSLFLLEGVAVYLEPAVLEAVLGQFRQVAAAGSRLAISVSLDGTSDHARSTFQASVAALGEPARSAHTADEAEVLLARAGWQVTSAGDPADRDTAARRQRLRSAGLLIARAARPVRRIRARPGSPRATRLAPSPPRPAPSSSSLSLATLLSQALVAFTIEFDNEGEHRVPHRTTSFGVSDHGDGAWLVSLVMWENCMRFVGAEPITVGELERLARTGTNLDGMRRWGYLTIDGTARKIHRGRPGPDAVLRATARGLRAREVWRPLAAVIEERWRERFGADRMGPLRDALIGVVGQLDPGLPDCLPILGQGLFSQGPDPALRPGAGTTDLARLPLSALLSRVLLAFALEYERESALSLAVSANLLRVLRTDGARPRDLPGLSGVSKEAVRWALGILTRGGLAVQEPDPAGSRGQITRLTSRGAEAQLCYHEVLGATEDRWRGRFTGGVLDALRQPLEALAVDPAGGPPPLFLSLEPYPGNWRARVRPPATLPHYPMVLHRGGYPDGS